MSIPCSFLHQNGLYLFGTRGFFPASFKGGSIQFQTSSYNDLGSVFVLQQSNFSSSGDTTYLHRPCALYIVPGSSSILYLLPVYTPLYPPPRIAVFVHDGSMSSFLPSATIQYWSGLPGRGVILAYYIPVLCNTSFQSVFGFARPMPLTISLLYFLWIFSRRSIV